MGERSEEPERDELAESVNDFFTTVSTMIKCEFQEEFANSAADFLHRIGRIARVGQSGLVPSFYNEPNPDLVTEVRQAGKLGQPVPHFQSTIMEKSISFTQPMDEQGDQGTSISGEDSWLHEALEDEKALGDHKIDSLKPSQTSNEVVLNSSSGEDLLVPNSLSLLKRYSSDDEDECHDISLQEDIVRTPEVGWDCTSIFDTDKVFHSREELTSWCKAVGRTAGVVVGIRKSDRGKVGRGARISYWCERSGEYKKKMKTIDKPAKRTSTKKCGCPFMLKGVKLPDNDQWKVKVVCGKHNHPIEKDTNFEGHSYIGRLSTSEEKVVVDMSKRGARPREVLRVIKQNNPDNVSTIRTIYNYKAKHRIC